MTPVLTKQDWPQIDLAWGFATQTLTELNWQLYLPKINVNDDNGWWKYTGVLAGFTSGPTGASLRSQHLELADRPKYERILNLKEEILEKNQDFRASIEGRNPDQNYWGGGVRSSHNPNMLMSCTKLPELGDHLAVTNLMYQSGELSTRDYTDLTDPDFPGIPEARAMAGASVTRFRQLDEIIRDIMTGAIVSANGVRGC